MKRNLTLPIILIVSLLIAEIGAFLAAKAFFNLNTSVNIRKFVWIWWLTTIAIYALTFFSRTFPNNFARNITVNVFFILLITKLIIALFFIFPSLFNWIRSFFESKKVENLTEISTSRRAFVSKVAIISAILPLTTFSWGILKTAYDFRVRKEKLRSPKIPESFKGFRIVQISDIHTGSLQGTKQLQKAIDLVNEQNADLIVFTGDLVNNKTDEAFEYKEILSQLKAKHGVYSTLGNHDYGDYNFWNSEKEKDDNMLQMIALHKELGWNLMLNEHIKIENGNDFISLIGIENWGGNYNFKRYGDLKKAYEGVEKDSYQILLSHDPSHWSLEVSKEYTDIDLTLAGHTHGFQFGIEIPGFIKWSPSKYIYPQWAGLYAKNEQKIYVNRGLGCLGYMGRIGIKPEITVIELA
jgi:hypothetical protein